MHLRDSLIPKYSALDYNGFCFSAEREARQALVTRSAIVCHVMEYVQVASTTLRDVTVDPILGRRA